MNLNGKKVLVTGAGGFIGSHLTEQLIEYGANVKAFIRYNSKNQWGWLESSPYKGQIEVYTGDIRDYDSVKAAVKDTQVVFHLAALIGIPYSYVSPLAYIRTNIEGTYNILQAARELGAERVIHTSTSEVYGTARYAPIDENHPLQPQSPYSASKIGADNLALSYFNSFQLPVVIARPFITYGPRQSARAIIPTIITQILSGKRQIELGNLTPTRDLNFVGDTVSGFVKIAEGDGAIGEVINIGSGREIAVGDLVRLIAGLLGTEIEISQKEQRVRPEASEVERLLGDNGKIRRLTGWESEVSLEEGLGRTIEWFRGNLELYKPGIYNV
jgi:NAD dependent epimerase/dehydratase